MASDNPDVTPRDALQIAQRALSRVNSVEEDLAELRDEHDTVAADLTAIQLRVSEIESDRPYHALTTNEKIGRVREELFERGRSNGGTATMTYDDVMWSVFDGNPSADHCYKLMRRAADADGFTYHDGSVGQKRVVVDVEQAKAGVAFSSANNAVVEGGGR